MPKLRLILARLRDPLTSAQRDKDIALELASHLQMLTEDKIRAGIPPEEARRQASLALGNLQCTRENCRDARGSRWLADLAHDLRYAIRALRHNPGFSLVAVFTVALGIGVTTLMFSVIGSVILRPLPYPEPHRLVSLDNTIPRRGNAGGTFSYPDFLDIARLSTTLGPVIAFRYGSGVLSEPGDAEFISGRQVSAALLPALGINPIRGRGFSPEDDHAGGNPVAVISDRLWQERFGRLPGAIGGRLVLDGLPYTVIGILPPALNLTSTLSFFVPGLDTPIDVFTLIGQSTNPALRNREMHPGIFVFARLRPGVTIAQAGQELAGISRRLAEQYQNSDADRLVTATPLQHKIVADSSQTLWILSGAVSLILLIACVNIASLLLARALSREREMAMRMALGAGRGRLIRQCLTESILLASCGGLLGALLAAVGEKPFLLLWPGGLPRADEIQFDARVFAFAIGVSLLSGLLFGLAPALRAPIDSLEQEIHGGARAIGSPSRRMHAALVAAEIALATVLLVSAGLLGHTMIRLISIHPGFDAQNVFMTTVALSRGRLSTAEQTRAAWSDLLRQIRRIPGVKSVAGGEVNPMSEDNNEVGYWTTPARPTAAQTPWSLLAVVTPDYLETMRIALRQGRFFEAGDRSPHDLVAVVDESLARHAFGNRNAVGQYLWIEFIGRARIVGVVDHVRYLGMYGDETSQIKDQVYVPLNNLPDSFLENANSMQVFVRTIGAPSSTISDALRRQIRKGGHDQAAWNIHSLQDLVNASLARQRFLLTLFGVFAALALLLAVIGIYGVLAWLTAQRVPEIGVRMALGATSAQVVRLVFRESLGMILAGIVMGTLASLGAARVLESLKAGVQGGDPLSFTVMILVLVFAAVLAIWIPARRAVRIDPAVSLRHE